MVFLSYFLAAGILLKFYRRCHGFLQLYIHLQRFESILLGSLWAKNNAACCFQHIGGLVVYSFVDCGCGGCVLTRERAFVTSRTCYDCYLTSNLPSKSGSEVAFIAAWLEFPTRPCVILTHSSGEEAVFFLCVCKCVCMRAVTRVTEWMCWLNVCFVLLLCPCSICPHELYVLCHIYVGVCALCVLHSVPFTVIPVPPQQGWTYLQCHPQTWGQQGAPGPLQRLLSFPCSLVPRSTPLLWQVLT